MVLVAFQISFDIKVASVPFVVVTKHEIII